MKENRRQGIAPHSDAGQIRPMSESERVLGQIERGEIRVGPDAAREIAQRVEAQGGFWGPRDEDA